ncbi:uncharacterized protein LOC117582288 [Drosophila guanche]|uniref:Protein MIS12 homolog n=1 Tax=Drosophila guanche TaxID=7266 RepID=A0A3B0K436_DROGU|nr:uncharacterized protein LOC117582288 [Drosophila guanche]SPP79731.1 Hypothetical predicted protein [Drosophila guanche]
MDFHDCTFDIKFFGFTAEQMTTMREREVKNMIGQAVENIIKKIETPATSKLLGAQKDEVIRRIKNSTMKNMKPVRELDKKFLRVPPHVLLGQDFHLEQQYTPLDEEKKNAQLKELELRFREKLVTLAKKEAEANQYESVANILQQETIEHKKIYEGVPSINGYKLT